MKILHSIVGFIIIVFGLLLLNITVDDDWLLTFGLKAISLFILFLGIVYLRKIAKVRKQIN